MSIEVTQTKIDNLDKIFKVNKKNLSKWGELHFVKTILDGSDPMNHMYNRYRNNLPRTSPNLRRLFRFYQVLKIFNFCREEDVVEPSGAQSNSL